LKKTRDNEDFVIVSEYQALNLCIHTPTSEFERSYFPHEEAKDIYTSIQVLRDRDEIITEGSLLREANALNDNVDAALIHTIFNFETDLSSSASILKVLKEASAKSNVRTWAEKIVEATSSADPLNANEIGAMLYEAQSELVNGQRKVTAKTLEQCLDIYEAELENRLIGKDHTFADMHLDDILTRKAAPGQAILIVGTTGTGKSAYSLNLINGMINNSIPAMYFSLEMDTVSTFDRLLSMRTDIPVEDWYDKQAIPSLKKKIAKERAALAGKPFRFIDDATVGLEQIQNLIREFKMTYKTDYICVFIDLITQVRDFTNLKGQGTLANTIEFAVNRLNEMAKTESVCFVCVAQLNRETDSAKVTSIDDLEAYRPTLNQIKNSNALGERARTVLSVFRPKYYAERLFPKDENVLLMEDVMEVQVMKQNQGQAGTVKKYLFDGKCFQIKPLIGTEEDDPDNLDRIKF